MSTRCFYFILEMISTHSRTDFKHSSVKPSSIGCTSKHYTGHYQRLLNINYTSFKPPTLKTQQAFVLIKNIIIIITVIITNMSAEADARLSAVQ